MSGTSNNMKAVITVFVKETLGCNCPDEVFMHIEYEQNIRLNDDVVLSSRINIGNRLLIYIIDAEDQASTLRNMHLIVAAGKADRDKRGFNRFRLVLISDHALKLRQEVEPAFSGLKNVDEKIHLHVIENAL